MDKRSCHPRLLHPSALKRQLAAATAVDTATTTTTKELAQELDPELAAKLDKLAKAGKYVNLALAAHARPQPLPPLLLLPLQTLSTCIYSPHSITCAVPSLLPPRREAEKAEAQRRAVKQSAAAATALQRASAEARAMQHAQKKKAAAAAVAVPAPAPAPIPVAAPKLAQPKPASRVHYVKISLCCPGKADVVFTGTTSNTIAQVLTTASKEWKVPKSKLSLHYDGEKLVAKHQLAQVLADDIEELDEDDPDDTVEVQFDAKLA